tara:strand:- start:1533 stop:1964 length:432 start_codon:yes stop_codon:yes gene_type:complete
MPKRRQEKGRANDIEQWNKMKEELKNNLLMKFTKDDEFVKQLVRDVQITNFDNRPGWHPYPDEVMEKKIEEHYKRIGENIYKKVSDAMEELETQRDAKRQRTEQNENNSPNFQSERIGGKKRRKSRRRKRTKKRRKSRRKSRR